MERMKNHADWHVYSNYYANWQVMLMSQSLVIIKIWLTVKLVFKCIIVLLILCQIIDNFLMYTFAKRWVEKQKTTAQADKTTAVVWYRYPRTRTSKRNIAQHRVLYYRIFYSVYYFCPGLSFFWWRFSIRNATRKPLTIRRELIRT